MAKGEFIESDRPVTVVTSFFKLRNPTKKASFYIDRAKFFLKNVENPIMFFTTVDIIEQIKDFRPKGLEITFIPMTMEDFTGV
jgi:hypothetical protein